MKNSNPWLLLAVVALAIIVAISINTCSRNKQDAGNVRSAISIKDDTVKAWVDEQGRNHGTKQVQEASAADLRAINPFVDSLMQVIRLKNKQLKAVAAIGTSTTGTVITKVDTVYIEGKTSLSFQSDDSFLKVKGSISDSLRMDYLYRDSLLAVFHSKTKGLPGFRRTKTSIDAYSLNPKTRIVGLTGLMVPKEKPKRFTAGPCGAYGYNGREWQGLVGVSIQYSLVRF